MHIKCVYILSHERWARHALSRDRQDIDKSIVHCTEAILLPPVSLADHSGNIVRLLFNLAKILLERSKEFDQPEDVKFHIEYLRYLRGLALDSFGVPRSDLTTSLIQGLGLQVVKLEAGDATQNIKEMLSLCRELLTSTYQQTFPSPLFTP